jgi:hypothetical protein
MLNFYIAQMDDYARRIKSTLLGNTLKKFPIKIIGSHWDHINQSNTRATFLPGKSFIDSLIFYKESLGVIDMSPNVTTDFHDRVTRCAETYTFALTNQTQAMQRYFPDIYPYLYEFNSQSIESQVDYALTHPEHIIEMGQLLGRQYREHFPSQAITQQMIDAVEETRLAIESHETLPKLQKFFGWPK